MSEQVTDQVTDDAGQDQGQDQATSTLGWRSALSDEFKDHDYVKTFEKPTDFVKAALEIKTEREELETKMKDAIFKPGKGATDEELTAYRKAMGIPENPNDYEFPETEGVEHDDEMKEWAGKTFFEAGLSKEQGALISQAWDQLVMGITEAEKEQMLEGIKTAETELREQWAGDYDGNFELAERAYKFFEGKIDGFKEFLEAETSNGKSLGNHPAMIQTFYVIGKAMGEDISPKSSPEAGDVKRPLGMGYEGMDHFKG